MTGGELTTLTAAAGARVCGLERELALAERAADLECVDARRLEKRLRETLDNWKGLLRRQAPIARQVLKKLLTAPSQFVPHVDHYTFSLKVGLGALLDGAITVASPSGMNLFPATKPDAQGLASPPGSSLYPYTLTGSVRRRVAYRAAGPIAPSVSFHSKLLYDRDCRLFEAVQLMCRTVPVDPCGDAFLIRFLDVNALPRGTLHEA